MFDLERDLTSVGPSLSRFTHALPDTSRTDAERIDLLRTLEDLKAAAAAAQGRLTADLAASRRRAHADAGLPARRHGEGIAAQVALAHRESPVRGAQHLGLALVLTTEMPHTLALMSTGRLSEWRATLLARETACLSLAETGRTVDTELCADPRVLDGLGRHRPPRRRPPRRLPPRPGRPASPAPAAPRPNAASPCAPRPTP